VYLRKKCDFIIIIIIIIITVGGLRFCD